MNRTEHEIDERVNEVLDREEATAFNDLGEQSVTEMMTQMFQGRKRSFSVLIFVSILVMTVLCIYSAVRFFKAEQTRDLIVWACAFFLFFGGISGWKMWMWLEMEKNAMIREIKRVELQLAHLSGQLSNR